VSPFSLVKFAGKPAGKACANISLLPDLAASNMRPANAIASGGNDDAGPFPFWVAMVRKVVGDLSLELPVSQ
jgi:hypothetical protein